MHVTLVMVHVNEDHIEDFKEASRENHRYSVEEAGNLRFDILQMEDDPTHFLLYEAYVSEQAAALHKETAHYKKWRETVAPWMAEKRQGTRYTIIAPEEAGQW